MVWMLLNIESLRDREMLKADPTMVELNKIAPYFYQSGLHVSSLPTSDSAEIAEVLPDVWIVNICI